MVLDPTLSQLAMKYNCNKKYVENVMHVYHQEQKIVEKNVEDGSIKNEKKVKIN